MRRRNEKNKLPQKRLPRKWRQLPTREYTPTKDRKTTLERIRDFHITWVVNVLAAILAFVLIAADALREPEISHSTAQTDDPFSVRFSLRNPSFIFPMTAMRLNCVLINIKFGGNLGMSGIPIDDLSEPSIPPGKTAEYECPVHKALDDYSPIITATIKIETTFSTLGYKRAAESELFSWNIVSRQWIKGEIVN